MAISGSATKTGRKHEENGEKRGEDRVIVDRGSGIISIFDGHGGSGCAQFLTANVIQLLDASLESRELFPYQSTEDKGRNLIENMTEALYETFETLENNFKTVAFNSEDTSGACGLIGLVHDEYCIIAHAGDCRAIFQHISVRHIGPFKLRSNKPIQITEDHKCDSGKERERIQEAGGSLEHGRILSLAPSRTIGDWDVKTLAPDVILSSPEINHFSVNGPAIMIIATDGVWDGVSNREAMEIVEKVLKLDPGNVDAAAARLVHEASRRTKDDVSAIVVLWD